MMFNLSPYFRKLETRCQKIESNLCIGIDPDPDKMPPKLGTGAEGIYSFCAEIIEATADSAAAFKPNLAFFESIGTEGWHVLAQVLEHVPADVPIIIDAKRGDIGSTARHYAKSLFEKLNADAVTVNPFMGHDSIKPFSDYADKGVYALCMTSNPGAKDFEMWFDLYIQIAKCISEWNTNGNLGLVVGATKPVHLANVRNEAPHIPMLVPGVGAQGGDLEMILAEARHHPRHKMLINISRSIMYASQKNDFARAARKSANAYRDRMNQLMNAR